MAVIDYQQFMNDRIQKVKPSGIRRFFDIANEMDHVISLSIGEPDFPRPGTSARRESNHWKREEPGIPQTGDLPSFVRKSAIIFNGVFMFPMTLPPMFW